MSKSRKSGHYEKTKQQELDEKFEMTPTGLGWTLPGWVLLTGCVQSIATGGAVFFLRVTAAMIPDQSRFSEHSDQTQNS